MCAVRNIFDQYDQPENRLTHALASTLHHDRSLLRPFLRWIGLADVPPAKALRITEQQVPGLAAAPEEEAESKGLPDLCIYTDGGWAALFEAKVQATVSADQLRRHRETARRQAFEHPKLIVLAVDPPTKKLPAGTVSLEWRRVYQWFSRRSHNSTWAEHLVQYMHVFEARMIADDYDIRGTVTMFDGLQFSDENPYTYREGKRLIRLLGDELRQRSDLKKLGIDPKAEGRSAITGRDQDGVWDFIPLKVASNASNFTDYPHLTMYIHREHAAASITVPNGVKGGFKQKLKDEGVDGFVDLLSELEANLRPVCKRSTGARPWVYAVQRHFRSQRSVGTLDGRVAFDLQTLNHNSSSRVKHQPEWAEALYSLLVNKNSNIQFGLTVFFDYACPVLGSHKATDLFAKTWLAGHPLLDFVISDQV